MAHAMSLSKKDHDEYTKDKGINTSPNPLLLSPLLDVIQDLPHDLFHLELGWFRFFDASNVFNLSLVLTLPLLVLDRVFPACN